MKYITAVFSFCFLMTFNLTASAIQPPQLPITLSKEPTGRLHEKIDVNLQRNLEKTINQNPLWGELVKDYKMAVSLVDLSDPEHPKYARVNGRRTMYSASMPKIAILLAAFQKIEDGDLILTASLKKDLTSMIRTSSNTAATRVIDSVGGIDSVNAVLEDSRYDLYDSKLGGGLWVGKRYAKTGDRVPDPVYGISHGASVMQVARFYYLLATGRLVSPERSKQMLDILVDPGINHKFVAALKETAPDAKIYRKSGTWRNHHADSALVWGPVWRRYILVGVVESDEGGTILKELVPAVEAILPHQ